MIFGGRAKGLRGEACLAPTGRASPQTPSQPAEGAGKAGLRPQLASQFSSLKGLGVGVRARRPLAPSPNLTSSISREPKP
jgi:hypothetical protein